MRQGRRFPYDLFSALGAGVTLLGFFTGVTSLPWLLGLAGQPAAIDGAVALAGGALSGLTIDLQVALSLLSMPLFCLINAWFLAAVTRSVLAGLDWMELNVTLPESVVLIGLLLPVAAGLDMLLVILLFGTAFRWLSILLVLACLVMTGRLLCRPGDWKGGLVALFSRKGA